jgi:hypothetical protein
MRAKFINENLEEFLSDQYTIKRLDNGDIFISPIDGYDFPYKIKTKEGKFILQQAYSPRTYVKPVFNKIKEFNTLDDAYDFIIKDHNKSVSYMTGRRHIYSKSEFYKDLGFKRKDINKL